MALQDSAQAINATATHGTSAVASVAGVAGLKYYLTGVSGSSDKVTASVLIKDGSTTIWQDRVSNTGSYIMYWSTPLPITRGASVSVTVDGTTLCNANLSGFAL